MLDRAGALVTSLMLASLALLPACGTKPDEEQCKQFSEHFIKLLEESRGTSDSRVKQLARTYDEKIQETCRTKGTVAEVDCVLAQASLADVEANCK
jgi:hypothetical protein